MAEAEVAPAVPIETKAETNSEDEVSSPTSVETKIETKAETNSEDEVSSPTSVETKIETKAEPNSEDEVSSPTPLEKKIMRQVEYYFGNNNLWRDKFLKEKIKEDEGWVTLECLITFNRLQALTMDFDEIIAALEKSKSGLLEIHEEKRKIRRNPANPLPDADDPVVRKAIKMKTLYVKGFPLTFTLDDVQDFILSQDCNNVFVKMRYDDNKKFKGSIFVELSTLEEAEKFVTSDMKCGDTVLKVMRREDYFEKKSEERHKKFAGKRKNKDGDEASGEKKSKDDADDEESKEPPRLGSVLHFKGCSTDTKREDLKALFGAHEKIEWVDFEIGATQGYIRFEGEGVAQKAVDAVKAAAEGKLVIKEAECEGRVIEGIEEKNYWILANEERKRAMKRKHDNKNNKYGKRNNFNKKEKNQEWRKRKRAWEYPKEKREDSENKPRGQHTKFDDDEGGEKKDNTEETTEKKLKVEGAAVEA